MCPKALTEHCLSSGAVTTSLVSLFQCLTTLWVKNLFLISSLNFSLTQLHAVTSPVTGNVNVIQNSGINMIQTTN